MGIGSNNSDHFTAHHNDEVSVPVAYPRQFNAAVQRIIEYFQDQDILRLTESHKHPRDGKYLYVDKGNDGLEFRLIQISEGKPHLHAEKVAEVIFSPPENGKFPDLNDTQAIFRLKANSAHFAALANILEHIQEAMPQPPSVHFVTEGQLATWRTKVRDAFADSGQTLSVREKTRRTGQNSVTTSTFNVDTADGKVEIATAHTNSQHVRLHIPQTTEEAATAEDILRSVTQPDYSFGPPKSMRSVSETKLGAKHVVKSQRKTHERIGYKGTPASALIDKDLQSKLYAYDAEDDILKDEHDLNELKRQLRRGKWKPARADLAQLHFRDTDTAGDKDRDLNIRRSELHPSYYYPEEEPAGLITLAMEQFAKWRGNAAPPAPTTTDEILRQAVEKFNGKQDHDKGRG